MTAKSPAKAAPKAAPELAAEQSAPKADNRVALLAEDIEAMLETMRRNGWSVHR